MIDDSKLKAKQNSVNGLMNAVNMTYTTSQLTESPLKLPITATIENGVITASDGIINKPVEYTGEQPISGKIVMDLDGNLTAVSVKYSDNSICSMGKGENGCTAKILTLPGMVSDSSEMNNAAEDNERKIFKGADPNNRIMLKENGVEKEYRIVSIESDGTIKVIRKNSIGYLPYDSKTSVTTGPRLNNDNTYCRLHSDNKYYGCNAWNKVSGTYTNGSHSGTVTQDASLNIYLNTEFYNTLDASVKQKIVTHSFNTTPIEPWALSNTLTSLKNATNIWEGKIGLLELRDWFNATSNSDCGNGEVGKGWYKENETIYECSLDNYLYLSDITKWWTLSSRISKYYLVYRVTGEGFVNNDETDRVCGVRPVFYLTSNISLTGNGSQENPYRIKN